MLCVVCCVVLMCGVVVVFVVASPPSCPSACSRCTVSGYIESTCNCDPGCDNGTNRTDDTNRNMHMKNITYHTQTLKH